MAHDSHPISTEDYFRNEVMKGNKQQTDDRISQFRGRFAKIHNDKQLNKTEMERKETEPKVIQLTESIGTECNETLPHSTRNKALSKKELQGQTQNQETFITIRQDRTAGNGTHYVISMPLCHNSN